MRPQDNYRVPVSIPLSALSIHQRGVGMLPLNQGSSLDRLNATLQVLGIIGALDPHTHKTNQASLSGEGRLEKEGVRPLRHGGAGGHGGGGAGGEGGDAGALSRVVPQCMDVSAARLLLPLS